MKCVMIESQFAMKRYMDKVKREKTDSFKQKKILKKNGLKKQRKNEIKKG